MLTYKEKKPRETALGSSPAFGLSQPIKYLFLITVLLQGPFHMTEHITQMLQKFVFNIIPAHGLIGVLDLEWTHFIFNTAFLALTLAVFFGSEFHKNVEWKRYNRVFYNVFLGGMILQGYHVIEHIAKLDQHIITGAQGTPGILGSVFDPVLYHFFLNLLVLLPLLVGFFGYRFHVAIGSKPGQPHIVAILNRPLLLLLGAFIGIYTAQIVAFTGIAQSGFAAEFALVTPLRTQLAIAGATLGVAIAFLAGVSMIALPCGYPLLFALTPQSTRVNSRQWLISLGLFAAGIGLTMAFVGVIVSLIGRSFIDTLLTANPAVRFSTSAILYGALGVVALLMAVRSLGFLESLRIIPGFDSLTHLITGRVANISRGRKQMFSFGALYGGGMSAGCPVPLYWALLFWAALSGNPAFGGLLLGAHGLGYVAPLLVIGLLTNIGIGRWIRKSITQKGPMVESLISGGLLAFGIFLIVLFAVMLPLQTFGIVNICKTNPYLCSPGQG